MAQQGGTPTQSEEPNWNHEFLRWQTALLQARQERGLNCVYGAGGLPPTQAHVDLNNPTDPIRITLEWPEDDEGAPDLALPPGVFRVGPGDSEYILFQPTGSDGYGYEWMARFTVVFNARESTFHLGTHRDPIRTFFGTDIKFPRRDYDVNQDRWAVPENIDYSD